MNKDLIQEENLSMINQASQVNVQINANKAP